MRLAGRFALSRHARALPRRAGLLLRSARCLPLRQDADAPSRRRPGTACHLRAPAQAKTLCPRVQAGAGARLSSLPLPPFLLRSGSRLLPRLLVLQLRPPASGARPANGRSAVPRKAPVRAALPFRVLRCPPAPVPRSSALSLRMLLPWRALLPPAFLRFRPLPRSFFLPAQALPCQAARPPAWRVRAFPDTPRHRAVFFHRRGWRLPPARAARRLVRASSHR